MYGKTIDFTRYFHLLLLNIKNVTFLSKFSFAFVLSRPQQDVTQAFWIFWDLKSPTNLESELLLGSKIIFLSRHTTKYNMQLEIGKINNIALLYLLTMGKLSLSCTLIDVIYFYYSAISSAMALDKNDTVWFTLVLNFVQIKDFLFLIHKSSKN